MHPPPVDAVIADLAARQGGAIGRAQLARAGLRPDGIRSRVRRGRLFVVRHGVYAVGHPALGPHGRLHAALLATGAGAILSHRTAAALWDLRATQRRRIEVTVVRGGRRGDEMLHVHRVRGLDGGDITVLDGMPVTTVARTLLDLADVLDQGSLRRAVEQAVILRRYDAAAMSDVLGRAAGRRAAPRLREAVAALSDTGPDLRSDLERDFLDLCAAHHLPPTPATNVQIAGFTVDAVWPAKRLVVEVDGRGVHLTPLAFERDRLRDRALALAGYRVIRITHAQMTRTPAHLAGDLAVLLA